MSDFTIIRRSLTSRMFSTVTTVITVGVAVGMMLVLLSMRDAGREAFENGRGNMHMIVSRDSSQLVAVLNGVFHANPPDAPIEWHEFQEISGPNFQGMRMPLPLEYAVPVQMGDSFRGFPVVATNEDYFRKFKPTHEGDDWVFSEGRQFEKTWECVLGAEVAARTGLKIGQKIFLTHGAGSSLDDEGDVLEAGEDPHAGHSHSHEGGHSHEDGSSHIHREFAYEIVGILAKTGGPPDRAVFSDLDSTWVLHAHDRRLRDDAHAHTTKADLLPEDKKITGIYIRVATREGRNMSSAQPMVFERLQRHPAKYVVADPSKQIESLFKIVSNIDLVFIGMAAVVMVSSGIAIMLALYNSMEQRRRQIAVLRVLGCSRGRVFGLVMTESAMIGFFGGLVGAALAVGGGVIVAGIMKERLGLVITPDIPLKWGLGVVAATIVMAALAGIVPAMAAYRTPVARNLRPLG